jgi:hypothetical protein
MSEKKTATRNLIIGDWSDVEKIMRDNPQYVLMVDICEGISYLNNEAIIVSEPWFNIDFNKFRSVPNDEFGVLTFEIRNKKKADEQRT